MSVKPPPRIPTAPPVYRPSGHAAQAKPGSGAAGAPSVYRPQNTFPATPPVYRPSNNAHIQAKPAGPVSVGPPVYRPRNTLPAAPSVYRPSNSAPIQAKPAGPGSPGLPVYRPRNTLSAAPPVYRPSNRPPVQAKPAGHRVPAAAPAVQRYVEFTHPTMGRLMVSENMRFLKHAGVDTDLWAQKDEVEIAASLMRDSIVTLTRGEEMTFLNETFTRVLVRQPTCKVVAPPTPSSSKAPVKSISSDSLPPLTDPFEIMLQFLHDSRGRTMGQIMLDIYKVKFPDSNPNSYAYGAFSAIRIQLALRVASLIEKTTKTTYSPYGTTSTGAINGSDVKAPIDDLMEFLHAWRYRTKQASGGGHEFEFLPTECGGFSKMIMPGKEANQQDAIVGNRMKILGLGDLPGPWQNHYAAVIMQDGGDTVTLESAASLDKWWFGMYGAKNVSQTFAAKTLLEKLRLGAERGEAGSQAALNYAQAVVHQDDKTRINQLGLLLPVKHKQDIDAVLMQAAQTVQDIQDAKTLKTMRAIEKAAAMK
ncbi:MAG: hypothetical protein FJW40_12910 [Acidobacteria bacterium]|nr:hypothetical protein [Acidobacteriota bacterium]